MLPAHVVEDWQRLQRLGNAAGLGRGSRVVMLIQGQNLLTITRERHEKKEKSAQNFITDVTCAKAIVMDNGLTSLSYGSAFVKIQILATNCCFLSSPVSADLLAVPLKRIKTQDKYVFQLISRSTLKCYM